MWTPDKKPGIPPVEPLKPWHVTENDQRFLKGLKIKEPLVPLPDPDDDGA